MNEWGVRSRCDAMAGRRVIAVGRNRCFFWLGLIWVALFLAGFTDVVCADPISFDMGRLMIGLLVAGVIALGILLVVYSLAVLGVELWVVRRLLGLDFGTGLKIVLLINVVSVLVGAVWTAIGGRHRLEDGLVSGAVGCRRVGLGQITDRGDSCRVRDSASRAAQGAQCRPIAHSQRGSERSFLRCVTSVPHGVGGPEPAHPEFVTREFLAERR